jgi:large subunit ribosomal protein L4
MLTVPVYDIEGRKVGDETIDPADFGDKVNKQLLHDVVLMHLANRRVGTVNTRGRADVAGSGKKLFRQKGTGNARAGSKRTNKRKGGGVAFARRNRDYRQALPKRAVRLAIRMALLSKFQDRQAIVIEDFGLGADDSKPRTRQVALVLRRLQKPDLGEAAAAVAPNETKADALKRSLAAGTVLIGLPQSDKLAYLSARNLDGVLIAPVAEFNTYDVLKQKYLLLTRSALNTLREHVKEPVRRKQISNPE